MDFLKITPDIQLKRKEVLALVENKTSVMFMFKQDYADTGIVLEANLNSNYQESYGTVKIKSSQPEAFVTDIANIEFLGDA